MTFKVGDRVQHTIEGFTGTIVNICGDHVGSIFVECDYPYEGGRADEWKACYGYNNGYKAASLYLILLPIPMKDGLEEYEAIMQAQEAL